VPAVINLWRPIRALVNAVAQGANSVVTVVAVTDTRRALLASRAYP
jgi:hypothetical protein